MKTQQSLHKAKTALLEAQQNTSDIIVSLTSKKASEAANVLIEEQKTVYDAITKVLSQFASIETLITNSNRGLLEQRALLKKVYNFTPASRYLRVPEETPMRRQLNEIWNQMSTPEATDYTFMVLRLSPVRINKQQASGYLKTYHLPTTIPTIIEEVGDEFGAGEYQIRIVDGAGKYVKSKTFTAASGIARLGKDWEENAELRKSIETDKKK
jgi:hypothetical protein